MKKAWDEFSVYRNQISADVQSLFQMAAEISDENEKQYKLFTDRYNSSTEDSTSIKITNSSINAKIDDILAITTIYERVLRNIFGLTRFYIYTSPSPTLRMALWGPSG